VAISALNSHACTKVTYPYQMFLRKIIKKIIIKKTLGAVGYLTLMGYCRSRAMDFNFPKKTGTGIEHRLAPCKSSKPCIKFINDCCTYDPDERYVK
jgi:hypothetical protein